MSDHSAIAWCDATWNVLIGCTKATMPGPDGKPVLRQGCAQCYAIRDSAKPRLQQFPQYQGVVTIEKDTGRRPEWTGKINLAEHKLDEPLRWRKPRKIFVNAFSDFWHPSVPDAWRDRIMARIAMAPWHTYMVLTKRPLEMQQYLSDPETPKRIRAEMLKVKDEPWMHDEEAFPWPLPQFWPGVSIEDDPSAQYAVPYLLRTPASVRWISAEPLLGPVTLKPSWLCKFRGDDGSVMDWAHKCGAECNPLRLVVVGGESGKYARPMEEAWALSLGEQCADAGTAFFFKQGSQANWKYWRESDFDKFPVALQVREYPKVPA